MGDKSEILLSWLSQYAYCKRRFYLQIQEMMNETNQYLAEGTVQHERVDKPRIERRGQLIKVTALQVRSEKLNLYGKCDSVEFEKSKCGSYIPFLDEACKIHLIEYKRGKMREEPEYIIQLTGQVLCLEEMFNYSIDDAELYYIGSRQRTTIIISQEWRNKTLECINDIAEILKDRPYIPPEYKKRCPRCSLYEKCSPKKIMTISYNKKLWERISDDTN